MRVQNRQKSFQKQLFPPPGAGKTAAPRAGKVPFEGAIGADWRWNPKKEQIPTICANHADCRSSVAHPCGLVKHSFCIILQKLEKIGFSPSFPGLRPFCPEDCPRGGDKETAPDLHPAAMLSRAVSLILGFHHWITSLSTHWEARSATAFPKGRNLTAAFGRIGTGPPSAAWGISPLHGTHLFVPKA